MGLDVDRLSGTVTIYRDRRTGIYKVQPMCRYGRLGLADAGDPVSMEPDDEAALVARIERALDDFSTNRLDTSTPRPSAKKQASFVRGHDAIMVARHKDGRTEVIPWEHDRGGYKAISAASLFFDPVAPAGVIANALREAFGRAG